VGNSHIGASNAAIIMLAIEAQRRSQAALRPQHVEQGRRFQKTIPIPGAQIY
jgi:hypothetical protein